MLEHALCDQLLLHRLVCDFLLTCTLQDLELVAVGCRSPSVVVRERLAMASPAPDTFLHLDVSVGCAGVGRSARKYAGETSRIHFMASVCTTPLEFYRKRGNGEGMGRPPQHAAHRAGLGRGSEWTRTAIPESERKEKKRGKGKRKKEGEKLPF